MLRWRWSGGQRKDSKWDEDKLQAAPRMFPRFLSLQYLPSLGP